MCSKQELRESCRDRRRIGPGRSWPGALLDLSAASTPSGAIGLTMRTQGKSSASLAPPPSNRSELLNQATKELRRAAYRYARQRSALVRRAGVRIDHLYARELVQDALADTWLGTTVTWNPQQRTLLDHIRRIIRYRSWKDVIGARRRPHVSIDGDEEVSVEVDDMQSHGTQGSVSPIVLAGVTASVVRDLRRLAAGDPAAMAILVAWEEGLVDREDVMDRTGLSQKDYKAARSRLLYLVPSLPQSLLETARTLLRSTS